MTPAAAAAAAAAPMAAPAELDPDVTASMEAMEKIITDGRPIPNELKAMISQMRTIKETAPSQLISSMEAMEKLITDAEANKKAPIRPELQDMITQMRAITGTTKDALREVETNSGEASSPPATAAAAAAEKKTKKKKKAPKRKKARNTRATASTPVSAAAAESYARMQATVKKELLDAFRPEFLNRLDEIIVFRSLTTPELGEVRALRSFFCFFRCMGCRKILFRTSASQPDCFACGAKAH